MLEIEEQKRGQLTKRIKSKSLELMGYELERDDLRLMPYLQYVLLNKRKIDNASINENEKKILAKWLEMGYILDGVTSSGRPMINTNVIITKEFWDIMNEIIWLGYCDVD